MINENGNMTIIKGDTLNIPVQLFQPNGTTPVNLTGCTIAAAAKLDLCDAAAYITFTIQNTNLTLGQFNIKLTAGQTAALDFDVAYYNVQITYADTTVETVLSGRVVLQKKAT